MQLKTFLKKQKEREWVELRAIKLEDNSRHRFCDAKLYGTVRNGRIILLLQHEKGYPSEQKGIKERNEKITRKTITNAME